MKTITYPSLGDHVNREATHGIKGRVTSLWQNGKVLEAIVVWSKVPIGFDPYAPVDLMNNYEFRDGAWFIKVGS